MEFKHPNYYKKLRKQYRDSQVVNQVKLSSQSQAASDKPQATDPEATSYKRQAPSKKVQASSHKLQAPRSLNQGTIEND
jgi:hypothetical protein